MKDQPVRFSTAHERHHFRCILNEFMSHISWTSKCCSICTMIYDRSIVQVKLICRLLFSKIILTERKKEKSSSRINKKKKPSSSSCAHMIICLSNHICFFSLLHFLVSWANVYFIFVLVTHKYVDLENCLHAYVERKNLHVAGCVCLSMSMLTWQAPSI